MQTDQTDEGGAAHTDPLYEFFQTQSSSLSFVGTRCLGGLRVVYWELDLGNMAIGNSKGLEEDLTRRGSEGEAESASEQRENSTTC